MKGILLSKRGTILLVVMAIFLVALISGYEATQHANLLIHHHLPLGCGAGENGPPCPH